MCGIVTVAGESTKQNDNILETLLILDQLRGIDSTGIAVIPRGDFDVNIAKNVGNAYDLFNTLQYGKAINCATRAIIGHNRSATSGTVIRKNAHPFENDSLVGVHNGTLTSKWKLADSKDFTVDSENLYHHIHKHGLKDCLNHLTGAWSLVWWDKTEETLNFLRNKERPMFLCWSKNFKSLYAASEKWMLQVALSRHGVEYTDINETEVDMHYSFPISKEGAISKPHVSAAASTCWEVSYQGHQNGGKWYGHNTSQQNISQKTQEVVTPTTKRTVEDNTYLGRFNVELEILAKTKDPFGAEYYACFDVIHPQHSIRLYINSKDEADITGEIITCNISPVAYLEGSRRYYKVSRSSVEVKPVLVNTEYFTDSKGNKLELAEWSKKHGCCESCGGVVDPKFDFRFTVSGQTICHECAADEEVKKLVSLRGR